MSYYLPWKYREPSNWFQLVRFMNADNKSILVARKPNQRTSENVLILNLILNLIMFFSSLGECLVSFACDRHRAWHHARCICPRSTETRDFLTHLTRPLSSISARNSREILAAGKWTPRVSPDGSIVASCFANTIFSRILSKRRNDLLNSDAHARHVGLDGGAL